MAKLTVEWMDGKAEEFSVSDQSVTENRMILKINRGNVITIPLNNVRKIEKEEW